MFDSKKQSASKQPWAFQVLTTEYSISGSYDHEGLNDCFKVAADVRYGIKAFGGLPLTAVQIQPAGSLTTPARSLAKWTLGRCTAMVAVMPSDDGSRAAAQKAFKDYKYPVAVVIYAGPFCIRGTAMLDDQEASLFLAEDWSLLPLQGAQIDSQVPGARLTGLQIPWLLLNGGMIHGIGQA